MDVFLNRNVDRLNGLAGNMLILYQAECWYGGIAKPLFYSVATVFFLAEKACWCHNCYVHFSWRFSLSAQFHLTNGSYMLHQHRQTDMFCAEWCSDIACMCKYILAGFLYVMCQIRTSMNNIALSFFTYLFCFCHFKEMTVCDIIPFKSFL